MKIEAKKERLSQLFAKSKKLFKLLPQSRKEFDEVQEKICEVLLCKGPEQLEFKF